MKRTKGAGKPAEHTSTATQDKAEAKPDPKSKPRRFHRAYERRWPIYAAGILLIEAILGIAAWTYFNGVIRHRPITAKTASFQIGVLSARVNEGDATFRPGDGYEFVILNTEIRNISGKAAWVTPVIQSYVQDGSFNHYELSPATVNDPFEAGVVQPGQSVTGQLSYVVPKGTQPLSFCFKDNPSGADSTCLPLRL